MPTCRDDPATSSKSCQSDPRQSQLRAVFTVLPADPEPHLFRFLNLFVRPRTIRQPSSHSTATIAHSQTTCRSNRVVWCCGRDPRPHHCPCIEDSRPSGRQPGWPERILAHGLVFFFPRTVFLHINATATRGVRDVPQGFPGVSPTTSINHRTPIDQP